MLARCGDPFGLRRLFEGERFHSKKRQKRESDQSNTSEKPA
jgi:hypothetical protein